MGNNSKLKCPLCNGKIVPIWYVEPNEVVGKLIREKKIYYGGLPYKNTDPARVYQMKYHCYKCKKNFSDDFSKYNPENKSLELYNDTIRYVENLIESLAIEVLNDLSKDDKEYLKKYRKYDHFGFGLYIRNNYIYNNDKIKNKFDADDLSYKIFNKIIEKL